ncbi:SLOG family protein [Lactococcus termiticola]|uniref:Uncharacterized protein n=1 Tax=Lactococcus termiticola TaxID=2169526 RepID=A0A2R5HJJ9_9LACT|nr:SLOG family protein [Lactococcus termiticola]GBG96788.1 hypothetical protein NtB2_00912 [Lactococcus termiticola]
MNSLLIAGYSASELGIFTDKDPKIEVIKKAIRRRLEAYAEEGLIWLIFTGNTGFEYWALEVAQEMKEEYDFQLATIFDFEDHGQRLSEASQLKIASFKQLDYVKYCFDSYANPSQLKAYNQYLIDKVNGAFVFYDEEHETRLHWLVDMMKAKEGFAVDFLTFEGLQEIAEEYYE